MQTKNFKYYSQLGMVFVGLLLTANVLGPKPLLLGKFIVPAGSVIFPMTYLVGVIITEVYGFAASRKVIWIALICNLFMALAIKVAIFLPYTPEWPGQDAYSTVLGTSSRLMVVSVFTYFIGELLNAYVVSSLKIKLKGKLFFIRGLCGNWLGEGIETCLFIPLAFYEILSMESILHMILSYLVFKVSYAFIAMPFISIIVDKLKAKEGLQDCFTDIATQRS
jgi:uncharacterized integral membrane protein (TIGR00697 family)